MTQYYIQTKSGPKGPFAASVIAEGVRAGRIPANASIEDVETGFKLRAGDIVADVGGQPSMPEPLAAGPEPAAAEAPVPPVDAPAAPQATQPEAQTIPPTAPEAGAAEQTGFRAAPWQAGTRPAVPRQRRQAATYPHGQAGYPQQPGYPQQAGYPQQTGHQQHYIQPGAYPQQTYGQMAQGHQAYPQQAYPQAGYPQQGYATPGYPQQAYPQSGYAAPYGYAAPAYPTSRATSGMAIASLVVAFAGFVTCPLVGIVSLILGLIALRECEPNGPKTGRGLAIAGIVIGALETLGSIIFILAMAAAEP